MQACHAASAAPAACSAWGLSITAPAPCCKCQHLSASHHPPCPHPSSSPLAPQDTESVYSVNWAFGAVVKTEINTTTGALSVELISDTIKPIRPCRNLRLGPLVSFSSSIGLLKQHVS